MLVEAFGDFAPERTAPDRHEVVERLRHPAGGAEGKHRARRHDDRRSRRARRRSRRALGRHQRPDLRSARQGRPRYGSRRSGTCRGLDRDRPLGRRGSAGDLPARVRRRRRPRRGACRDGADADVRPLQARHQGDQERRRWLHADRRQVPRPACRRSRAVRDRRGTRRRAAHVHRREQVRRHLRHAGAGNGHPPGRHGDAHLRGHQAARRARCSATPRRLHRDDPSLPRRLGRRDRWLRSRQSRTT